MSGQDGIVLRRAERADIDVIIEWLDDPLFLGFLHGDSSLAPKQLRERLVAMLGSNVSPMMMGGGFYIIDDPREGPLGLASFTELSWRNRYCRFDLHLTGEAKANGLEDACLRQTLCYAFGEMNLHRVSRDVAPGETACVQRMEAMGARREAVLRRHVVRNEKAEDVYRYGLLREEFRDALFETTGPAGE